MSKQVITVVALAAIAFGISSTARAFPAVGNNPLGPEFIITENANGSFTTALNPVT